MNSDRKGASSAVGFRPELEVIPAPGATTPIPLGVARIGCSRGGLRSPQTKDPSPIIARNTWRRAVSRPAVLESRSYTPAPGRGTEASLSDGHLGLVDTTKRKLPTTSQQQHGTRDGTSSPKGSTVMEETLFGSQFAGTSTLTSASQLASIRRAVAEEDEWGGTFVSPSSRSLSRGHQQQQERRRLDPKRRPKLYNAKLDSNPSAEDVILKRMVRRLDRAETPQSVDRTFCQLATNDAKDAVSHHAKPTRLQTSVPGGMRGLNALQSSVSQRAMAPSLRQALVNQDREKMAELELIHGRKKTANTNIGDGNYTGPSATAEFDRMHLMASRAGGSRGERGNVGGARGVVPDTVLVRTGAGGAVFQRSQSDDLFTPDETEALRSLLGRNGGNNRRQLRKQAGLPSSGNYGLW